MSARYRIIEIVTTPRLSDEFSSLLVKLYWNNRTTISRDGKNIYLTFDHLIGEKNRSFLMNLEVTKLIRDCCIFDLKQALDGETKKFEMNTLDNDCFTALTNTIEPKSATGIEQEQFYNWVRVQFPTLFYGFELWLRKNSTLTVKNTSTSEASAKVYSFMKKFILILLFYI
jgi:hypothetical protein